MQKEVNNRIFYRFVNNRYIDDMWEVGNDFIVDDNFESFAESFFTEKPTLKYKDKYLFNLCDDAIKGKINKDDLIAIKQLIKAYLNNQPLNLREYILETIRREEFPNLISRAHCLFLFDKPSLKYWNDTLNNEKKTLFKLEVSGTAFCGHACLLPQTSKKIYTQEYQARCYWQNKLQDNPYHITNDREYLFQGKVKVLKKY